MVFKILKYLKNKSKKPIIYWLLIFIMFPCFAIKTEKLKDTYRNFSGAKGIYFNRFKKSYYSISATRRESEKLFKFKDVKNKEKVLKVFSANKLNLVLLTFDEFLEQTKPMLQHIKYLDKLPHALNKYLELLAVDVDEYTIKLTFISSPLSIFYESKERKASKVVTLEFMDNLNKAQVENFSEFIGKSMTGTLAHESFHFLVAYAKYPNMPELREEVYANLFGKCVAYEINTKVITGFKIEPYPTDFYQNMKKELKSIIKATKKHGYEKSLQAELIAMYYFRYIIDDHFSQEISSENIPKFCQKLFSEHNFKHPIEKKPPKWFKAFLMENKKQPQQ